MSDLVAAILPRAAGQGDQPQDGGGARRRLGVGRDLPSPLAGEGARRADEGSLARWRLAQPKTPSPSDPSSGAARHLLPQGEKGALGSICANAAALRGGVSAVLSARLPGSFTRFVTDLLAYGLVSVAALACDCGLLLLLARGGMHYLIASAISFTAGLALAYVLSVRFVFRTRRARSREVEAVGFVAVGVVGLVLTQLLLYVLVARLALALATAKVVTTGIVFFFNFVTRRSLVFAGSSRAPA